MTIDGSSLLSAVSSQYSSVSYSTAKTKNSAADGTSSYSSASSTVTSGSSKLSEEEEVYDTDGDGILSVTERAAYLQAQIDKKSSEAVESASSSDSGEKEKDILKKMQNESMQKQKEIFERMSQSRDESGEANQNQIRMRHANEAYRAQQYPENSEISSFSAAV